MASTELKFCKDCTYFKQEGFFAYCTHPALQEFSKDLVSGGQIPLHCNIARSTTQLCGRDAIHFQK